MSAQGTVSVNISVDTRQLTAEHGEVQRRLGATVRYMALRASGRRAAVVTGADGISRVVART